jgi:predicted Zn-dependent protease
MAASGWLPFELQDNEVQTYVRRMAARIAANSDLKVPLRVTVLDSEGLKAVAVPGGFLYVTSGVIRAARSESELAGVLSREVARIAARHAARAARGSLLSKVVVPVAQLAAGIFTAGAVTHPAAYYGIGYGVEGVSNLMVRQFNGTDEKFETEADQLGIQYAWKAGYDPRGFVGFLDSISDKTGSFLSNEPRLQERMMNAFSEIQYLPPQEELWDSGEFEKVRERLR